MALVDQRGTKPFHINPKLKPFVSYLESTPSRLDKADVAIEEENVDYGEANIWKWKRKHMELSWCFPHVRRIP